MKRKELIIECESAYEMGMLLKILEINGYFWIGTTRKPTRYCPQFPYEDMFDEDEGDNVAIFATKDGYIEYSPIGFYNRDKDYCNIPKIKYKDFYGDMLEEREETEEEERYKDIKKFLAGRLAFHCPTEESARECIAYLYSQGFEWRVDIEDEKEKKTLWEVYEENTTYYRVLYREDDNTFGYGHIERIEVQDNYIEEIKEWK
nr:MAG TPA: hypothetical protein [Caudoviricetes sp.]